MLPVRLGVRWNCGLTDIIQRVGDFTPIWIPWTAFNGLSRPMLRQTTRVSGLGTHRRIVTPQDKTIGAAPFPRDRHLWIMLLGQPTVRKLHTLRLVQPCSRLIQNYRRPDRFVNQTGSRMAAADLGRNRGGGPFARRQTPKSSSKPSSVPQIRRLKASPELPRSSAPTDRRHLW